jgi:SAM-dependent methyltransferase
MPPNRNKTTTRLRKVGLQRTLSAIKFPDNVKSQRGSLAYGELLQPGIDILLQQLDFKRRFRFLDIGSGLGQLVLYVAFCYGSDCIGVEIQQDLHLRAADALAKTKAQAKKKKNDKCIAKCNRVRLVNGDILECKDILDLSKPDYNRVFINNRVFDPTLNLKIVEWLESYKFIGIIVTTAPLVNGGRTKNSVSRIKDEDVFARLLVQSVEIFAFPAGSFSWQANGGKGYRYNIKIKF